MLGEHRQDDGGDEESRHGEPENREGSQHVVRPLVLAHRRVHADGDADQDGEDDGEERQLERDPDLGAHLRKDGPRGVGGFAPVALDDASEPCHVLGGQWIVEAVLVLDLLSLFRGVALTEAGGHNGVRVQANHSENQERDDEQRGDREDDSAQYELVHRRSSRLDLKDRGGVRIPHSPG